MLETGRAFDEEHAPRAGGRLDERAADVVLGHQLAGFDWCLDFVDGWRSGAGRDLKNLAHWSAVAGRRDASGIDQPAILEQPQIERRLAEPMAHGGHRQLDARIVEDCFGRRDAEDFAISARRGCAHADAENRHRRCGGALASAARVPAIGNEHDASDGPALILVAHADERTLDVAAARRGG